MEISERRVKKVKRALYVSNGINIGSVLTVVFIAGTKMQKLDAQELTIGELKSAQAASIAMVMKTREGLDGSISRLHDKMNRANDALASVLSRIGRVEGLLEKRGNR